MIKHAILLILTSLIFTTACKKKEKTEPEPDEYFSFYADGEYHFYPQDIGNTLFGGWQTLSAGMSSATVGYGMAAYSRERNTAPGAITFTLSENPLTSDKDTVILDGYGNSVFISKFKDQSISYVLRPPLKGKIIFSQRTEEKLIGTFEFESYKRIHNPDNSYTIPDTVFHFTQGKFAIIPKL